MNFREHSPDLLEAACGPQDLEKPRIPNLRTQLECEAEGNMWALNQGCITFLNHLYRDSGECNLTNPGLK